MRTISHLEIMCENIYENIWFPTQFDVENQKIKWFYKLILSNIIFSFGSVPISNTKWGKNTLNIELHRKCEFNRWWLDFFFFGYHSIFSAMGHRVYKMSVNNKM